MFGGGPKAFEKYEAGEVTPSSSMTRLLLLAAKRPEFFRKGAGQTIGKGETQMLREVVRKSSVGPIYERIYDYAGSKTDRGSNTRDNVGG